MSTAMTTTAPHGTALVAWDQELRGASYLVKSGLCPAAIKTPEAALFVILAGRDLGLSPVASLRNITVIQGKIEVAADMQLALFHRAGGRSRWLEISATRAALQLHAPWMDAPHVSEFTAADAARAGLTGENWKKYPKAMLRSRAITQGLKDIGYDATAGVYAPGEIGGPEAGPSGEVVEPADTHPVNVTTDGEIVVEGTAAPAPQRPAPSAAEPSAPAVVTGEVPACPKCSGPCWDNRVGKKNPRAPDFRCKDKACDGVIWPPKAGRPDAAGRTFGGTVQHEREFKTVPEALTEDNDDGLPF